MLKSVGIALLLALTMSSLAHAAGNQAWVSAWTAAPDSAGPALKAQTIRQVVRASVGGSTIRIRLSNLFGTAPVVIGPVHVAAYAGEGRIQADTDRTLRFGNATTVTIAAGASMLSDPVAMLVPALGELAVSMYLPAPVAVSTIHGAGMQTAFMTTAGDTGGASSFVAGQTDDSRYFLTDVELVPAGEPRTLVVVGDSIADGIGSRNDHNARWTDRLATRLQASPKFASTAVVSAGIAGNRILRDASEPFVGPSVLSRFERDALGKPGVRWILLHAGINDITAAQMLTGPEDQVSAAQIIDGMKTLAARARARGIGIWGATLLPFEGTKTFYSEVAEAKREAVNAWIRGSADLFDAVIDFDQMLRDPAKPRRLRAEFDSGDHLHPNEAGYQIMADAIDLRLLDAAPRP
jgi:lysophospholipase L1-like esterase